jgi:cytochrome c551/c552
MEQPMPDLIVSSPMVSEPVASQSAASMPAVKIPTSAAFSFTPAILAGVLGFAFVCLAIGLAWRKRTRWALAVALVGLLAWGVGVASAASRPASLAPPANNQRSAAAAGARKTSTNKSVAGKAAAGRPITQEEYGKILFVAKGCATCHVNPRVEAEFVPFRVDVGKNLTGYVASAEFLRIWLKDPKAVKPKTEMPNLELSQAEIEALIAFINSLAESR